MIQPKRTCQGECGLNRQASSYSSAGAKVCNTCKRKTSRAAARKRHVEKTYEITMAEHDAILAVQGGVCAICGGSRSYNLAVDHEHAVADAFGVRASVRGLLCKRCNKFLRDIRDDVSLLQSAIKYLQQSPAKKVLFP